MTPTEKQQSLDILTRRYGEQKAQVTAIDTRLAEYFDGLIAEPQYHNGDELLCAVKLLRLMRTYEVDAEEVQRTLHVFEGDWQLDRNGIWKHLGGGVKQPGRQGAEVYRFEPFQVFVFTAVYGIKAWIDTELTTDDRYPTATERINGNRIEDLRRLCVRFICFMPRKTNKTGLAALIGARDFMLGDDDAMIVCCANSQDQSKILFKRLQMLLGSFDPQGKRIRFTATETNWHRDRCARHQPMPCPQAARPKMVCSRPSALPTSTAARPTPTATATWATSSKSSSRLWVHAARV